MEQPPSTEKTGPQKGDVIDGKLEIEGIIAEGRTSTVVSALDRGNNYKKVAVKIARGSDLESVERFKRGARGMAKLTSPYTVRVLNVGTTQDGAPCMTMELLEGRTLAQKITQSGPLPIDEATRLMLQVCDSVAEAHHQKLLHRDLDAENLFLAMPRPGSGGEPSIRVLDYGLAPVWRLGKGDGRLRPGDVPGTSFAMAPELARGSDVDERVDIWGIGACLFRLLTNKHPYNARNLAELCTRILAERPPDLAKVRPDVTPGLAAFVKKCLEREPSDRYKNIREVIRALEETKDEAPYTPQVPTEKATLDQLRMIESHQVRTTPMQFRAAEEAAAKDAEAERITDPGAIPSSNDDDEGATQIHRKEDVAALVASVAKTPPAKTIPKDPTTLEPSTAPRDQAKRTIPKEPTTVEPPTEPLKARNLVALPIGDASGEIGAPTPQTMRIVPAFEAIANRLEPPKPKRSEPPPKKISGSLPLPPPPLKSTPPKLDLVPEDGPSTQPLGRLSPFAELPKPQPIEEEPPSDDPTILPRLIGAPPAPAAPLPKPTPERMAAETIPPAPPAPVAIAIGGTLPRPSPAMMVAETIPRGVEPPIKPEANPPAEVESQPDFKATTPLAKPLASTMASEAVPRGMENPAHPSPLVFQASPRVLDMPPPAPTGPPPMAPSMATPTPAPLPSFEPMSPRPHVIEPPPPSEAAPAKSRLLVPLIFALGIAISVVVGLYLAKLSTHATKEPAKPSASPVVASPPTSGSGEPAGSPLQIPSGVASVEPEPETPAPSSPSAIASHRHHRRTPPPTVSVTAPAPVPAPAPAPIKSGNVYDPSNY